MFSQTTEYALRAMVVLSLHPEQLVSAVFIAERAQVPPNYLAKVLQQLSSTTLVSGRRGVGGGYKLTRPSNEIYLIDIVKAVGAVDRIKHCPLDPKSTHLCALHHVMDLALSRAITTLESISLDTLLHQGLGDGRPLCGSAVSTVAAFD